VTTRAVFCSAKAAFQFQNPLAPLNSFERLLRFRARSAPSIRRTSTARAKGGAFQNRKMPSGLCAITRRWASPSLGGSALSTHAGVENARLLLAIDPRAAGTLRHLAAGLGAGPIIGMEGGDCIIAEIASGAHAPMLAARSTSRFVFGICNRMFPNVRGR